MMTFVVCVQAAPAGRQGGRGPAADPPEGIPTPLRHPLHVRGQGVSQEEAHWSECSGQSGNGKATVSVKSYIAPTILFKLATKEH